MISQMTMMTKTMMTMMTKETEVLLVEGRGKIGILDLVGIRAGTIGPVVVGAVLIGAVLDGAIKVGNRGKHALGLHLGGVASKFV